jgi:DNA polymerase (family 10)
VGLTAADPLTLGRAWDLFDRTVDAIRAGVAGIDGLEATGELRRNEPIVTAVAIVGSTRDPVAALASLAPLVASYHIVQRDATSLAFVFRGARVEVQFVPPDAFGSTLFHSTGSATHREQMQARGLAARHFPSEEDLYASVGLPWIPPEARDGGGEIDAAAAGTLPAFISRTAIRGDLHMHTIYSDGRNSVAEMVAAADALGYEYIAITDHSWSGSGSRTQALANIPRQRDEIHALRESHPRLAILHGVEVDIDERGGLDFPDDVLAGYDIVLASLHSAFGHDGAQLTERSLAAIRHPLVNILCHPANQLAGRHPGYPLDFEALYEAAAVTGTALEIDGAPSHMDLTSDRARAAVAAGATLTIDSDCHRAEALGRQMQFGVGIGRRGWIEARHVLNTRPLAELERFILDKRQGNAGV